MPQFIPIERTESYAPNIVGVVNWPEHLGTRYSAKEKSPLPARGYIFDIHLEEVYGNLENAVKHFVMLTENRFFSEKDAHYLLGHLKGRIGQKYMNPYLRDNEWIVTEAIERAHREKKGLAIGGIRRLAKSVLEASYIGLGATFDENS